MQGAPEQVSADALQPELAVSAGYVLVHNEPLVWLRDGVRHRHAALRNARHVVREWRLMVVVRRKCVPHHSYPVCCSHICAPGPPCQAAGAADTLGAVGRLKASVTQSKAGGNRDTRWQQILAASLLLWRTLVLTRLFLARVQPLVGL